MNPKVSVITFVNVSEFNGRFALLDEALKSVANQKYDSYEHIIVDDGSSMEIEELVSSYPHTRYLFKPASGIITSTDTFNLGHIQAQGEYCIYLASDDLQLEGSLSVLSKALDENESWAAVCGGAYYEYPNETVEWSPEFHDIESRLIEVGNFVSGCAVMWRKCIFNAGNSLPPNIVGFCSDYDLWVRISELGHFGTIDTKVVTYRSRPDSTRHKTKKKKFLSHHQFDLDRFQYSKNSRLRYVKNSALKRRVEKQARSGKTCSTGDLLDAPSSDTLVGKMSTDNDVFRYNYNEAFFKNIDVFSNANLLTEDKRNEILAKWEKSINCNASNETDLRVYEYDRIYITGISAAAVWITWLCNPEQHITLAVDSFRSNVFYYDYINWAYVDEIRGSDIETIKEFCLYLGLQDQIEVNVTMIDK